MNRYNRPLSNKQDATDLLLFYVCGGILLVGTIAHQVIMYVMGATNG